MRQHAHAKRGPGQVPPSIVVRRQHAEAVASRRQVGVKRRSSGARIDPSVVEAFQLIAVLDFLGSDKTQAGILNLKPVGARSDGELLVEAEGAGMVIDENFFDGDRW